MLGAQAAKGTALRYFPIFFDLDGRDVLIVGGGEKALQKLRLLAKTTARLRIVAPDVSEDIAAAAVPTLIIRAACFHRGRPRRGGAGLRRQ